MKNALSVASLATLLGAACGPSINLNERPLFSNGSNTLTFLAFDAFTGAGIEDATLKITVGTYELQVTKKTGNAYIISQVPFGTHLASFEAPGYVGFLGQPSGDCNSTLTNPASQCFKTYQVALYPVKGVDSDVVVKSYEAETGIPVAGGTVVATLTGASNLIGTGFNNPLPGSLTLRPTTIIAAIGEGGFATLAKERLVLGGTYSIDIFGAKTAANAYLTPTDNLSIVAGRSFPQLNVFLGPPAQSPVALSANNEKVVVAPNLIVKFPFPVEICSEATAHGWSVQPGTGLDGNADGVKATPATTSPVTAALSGDGGQLTLTANFATTMSGASTFQTADGLLEVSFFGVRLKVKGSSSCVGLGSVRVRDNNFVSTVVRMAAAVP
jgi:hypothetical protein